MLSIEIFSDAICPWCFIGKRRLDRALASEVGEGVALRWRPFMLYPNAPKEGWDRFEFLQRRYGDNADKGRIPERLRREAEDAGIELRYDLIQRTPNTLMAHRLMDWFYAASRVSRSDGSLDVEGTSEVADIAAGLAQHKVAEVLFQGYFCRGMNVGDVDVLIDLATEAGANSVDGLRAYLLSDKGTSEVHEQLSRAPELDIAGVPGYWLGGRFLLPGAQSEDTIAKVITRAKDRFGS